jgi:hypothetical protein
VKLATLKAATEAETAFGGRTRSWAEVATLWVDLKVSARERAEADQRPVLTETAEALARDHPLAAVGQRLTLDGDNWRLVRLARGAPKIGRMTLFLEKDPT